MFVRLSQNFFSEIVEHRNFRNIMEDVAMTTDPHTYGIYGQKQGDLILSQV